jgi:hypothetical protein
MKKLTMILAALAVTLSVNAQVKFGVKAGLNVSNISNVSTSALGMDATALESDGMAIGFHAGAFVNFSFGRLFGLQPEVLFSMQGGKQKLGQLAGGSDAIDFTFDYINVPVLFEIKPFANFGILVGPQVGLNIYKSASNGEETYSGSDFDDSFEEIGGSDLFKSLDFAVALGVQYTFINHLTIGARYNLGLTNTFSSTVSESIVNVNVSGWKNNVAQVSIAWSF